MQPAAVARGRLDGVPERVPKVECRAQPGLSLVLGHDGRLDLARALDHVRQRLRVARHQLVHILLKPHEELGVPDEAVLYHLGDAAGQLALGKRAQRLGVDEHALWLVEGAQHVFAQRVVDARLAAHARVHHGHERGGHLHEVHPALVARRREARHVAHHPAAQRHKGGVTPQPALHGLVPRHHQRAHVLVRLAVGEGHAVHLHALPTLRRKRSLASLQVQRRHRLVGDHQRALAADVGRQQRGVIQQARADVDWVRALAKLHRHRRHQRGR
mmetsp:Transcript_22194/g.68643  ORF Transcript_22194/g.68643 Transcript_22194/m.68643 type:complete len:272 (+) Transcript_22194:574-1389(+)